MASDDERRAKSPRRRHDQDSRSDRHSERPKHSDTRRRNRSTDRDVKLEDRRRSRDRDGERSRTPDAPRRKRSRDRDERRADDSHRDRRRRRSQEGDDDRRRPKHSDELSSSRRRSPVRQKGPLPSQADSFALTTPNAEGAEKPKEMPNYYPTGILAAASNQVEQADGTVITLKYHEPPEARKPPPRDDWKLFVFKDGEVVDTIDLGMRSCWLIGKESRVVDYPVEHPSISKQHCVVQFRFVEKVDEYGDRKGRVKPYVIDLESANGTFLNGERVPEGRYLELRSKDMVKLGQSSREYVVMLDRP